MTNKETLNPYGGGVNPEISKTLNSFNSRIGGLEDVGVTWKLLTSFTPTKNAARTISGCTPNKPLFLIAKVPAYSWAWEYIAPISGTTTNMPNWNNQSLGQFLLGGAESNTGSNCIVFIPTSSTISFWHMGNNNKMTIYVYN